MWTSGHKILENLVQIDKLTLGYLIKWDKHFIQPCLPLFTFLSFLPIAPLISIVTCNVGLCPIESTVDLLDFVYGTPTFPWLVYCSTLTGYGLSFIFLVGALLLTLLFVPTLFVAARGFLRVTQNMKVVVNKSDSFRAVQTCLEHHAELGREIRTFDSNIHWMILIFCVDFMLDTLAVVHALNDNLRLGGNLLQHVHVVSLLGPLLVIVAQTVAFVHLHDQVRLIVVE